MNVYLSMNYYMIHWTSTEEFKITFETASNFQKLLPEWKGMLHTLPQLQWCGALHCIRHTGVLHSAANDQSTSIWAHNITTRARKFGSLRWLYCPLHFIKPCQLVFLCSAKVCINETISFLAHAMELGTL